MTSGPTTDGAPATRGRAVGASGGDSRGVVLDAADLGGAARGWFTRSPGGVSLGQYEGLNLGGHVGDEPGAVRANRAALDAAIGARAWYVDQVHGREVAVRDRQPDVAAGQRGAGTADALVLDARDSSVPLAAAILVADCVPVLLAAPGGLLAAVVHVGRAGLVAGVLPAALERLTGLDAAGARPGGLRAAIGPSICGACYEVSAELRDEVAAAHPAAASETRWGTPGLDVAAGVRAVLRGYGIEADERAARCTYEHHDLYSYRRATHAGHGVTGRVAGVVRTAARA